MDPDLVDKIVHEVKSQGVFDEFRRDSMADVDTKPAYQNLRQRVDNAVKKFLAGTRWTPEANKNQLREKLRRHIAESGFLDVGVERIVDQVVNPKIGSVFQPRIEEIAYKFLGLPPPPKHEPPPPPPLMHPLPPLPIHGGALQVETSNLLPTDLEQVSPDSDNATIKSENKEDQVDDDEESPPFEPLVTSTDYSTKMGWITQQNMDLSRTPSPPPGPELKCVAQPPPPMLPPQPQEKPPPPPPPPLPPPLPPSADVYATNTAASLPVEPSETLSNGDNYSSESFVVDAVAGSGECVGTPVHDAEMQDTTTSNNTAEYGSEREIHDMTNARVSQESQLSQVSSDSHLSTDINESGLQVETKEHCTSEAAVRLLLW